MFSADHIVSYTLSAALHLTGLLLLGFYAVHHRDAPATAAPELEVTAVELTLTEIAPDVPGAGPKAAQAPAAEISPLPLPEPVPEMAAQPQLQEKPDFADALPEPEAVPEPKPVPAPVPVAKPVPPAEKPKPAPAAQAAPAPTPAAPAAAVIEPALAVPGASQRENAGAAGSAGHIDAHPSLDRPIRPSYPIGARRRGEEGTVILDASVGEDGRTTGVTLVSSSGFPDLDRAAVRAVEQARFKPGARDGRPVASFARLTLIFRLRDL